MLWYGYCSTNCYVKKAVPGRHSLANPALRRHSLTLLLPLGALQHSTGTSGAGSALPFF